MAAPHVSGAVALLLQRHPGWSPAQVKAALTATARPLGADGTVGPTRAGAGLVDVAAADDPLVRATPTGVSFALVHAGTTVTRAVAIDDAGGGPAPWAASVESDGAPSGTRVTVTPTVSAPGTIALTLDAGTTDGEVAGDVLLRRDGVTRRVPFWGRVTAPKLDTTGARTLPGPGVYTGDTRGRPALVDTYRYPEVPRSGPVSARLTGPEQVFRVRVGPGVANFGVVVIRRGPGSRVEPRVVRSGDENRLTGYSALPLDQNPYVEEFGGAVPAAGALRPAAGVYDIVFDSATRAGAGTFRFRLWIDDGTPPKAKLARRTFLRGDPIRLRVSDSGSGVDVRSLEATLDGKAARARLVGTEIRIPTGGLAAGRHRLRVSVADYQETRNNENVTRILPNTRVVSTVVTVRAR
jgi:hypothetical protein